MERQRKIQDMQLDTGTKMLTAVQNLETSSSNIAKAFTDVVGPGITTLTGVIEKFTKAVNSWITSPEATTPKPEETKVQ